MGTFKTLVLEMYYHHIVITLSYNLSHDSPTDAPLYVRPVAIAIRLSNHEGITDDVLVFIITEPGMPNIFKHTSVSCSACMYMYKD